MARTDSQSVTADYSIGKLVHIQNILLLLGQRLSKKRENIRLL